MGKALAAVGQMCATSDMKHNLSQCTILVEKAAKAGASALFLPEAADYISLSPTQSLSLVQPVEESIFVQGLQTAASTHRLPISVGIHEPTPERTRVRNTLIWIDATGRITHRYQKLHLFDLVIPNGPVLKESNSVEPGTGMPTVFDSPIGKIGPLICFDLRFPEPSIALKRQGAEVILYPSAFTVPTGKKHWHVLLRARAIECESFVIAAAQAGRHNEKRESYGHSIIISPSGEVLAELGEEAGPEIAIAEVDLEEVSRARTMIPLLRRTDVYPEI